jgi:hypothetical protein
MTVKPRVGGKANFKLTDLLVSNKFHNYERYQNTACRNLTAKSSKCKRAIFIKPAILV